MDTNDTNPAVARAMQQRQMTRSMQTLMGLVAGITADGHLHDMEIRYLNAWLEENEEVTHVWPGSAIAQHLREVIADDIITEVERDYLLKSLQMLCGVEFSETGSITPEVAGIPYAAELQLVVPERVFCLTGEFLYGTRNECERLLAKAGGLASSSVTKKVHYLVVGTNVSPNWVNTSYGRKIQKAMELKSGGHGIFIVREQNWLDALAG